MLLDNELIKALKAKNFDKMRLSIPEFIADDEYGFTYTNNASRENVYYAYLDIAQLGDVLKLDKVTPSSLRNRRVYAFSPIEDQVLDHKYWTVYECLLFEYKLGKKYFILTEGRWCEVDSDFYRSITNFIVHTLRVEPYEKVYSGIDISDHKKKKNLESIFNAKVCEIRPTNILFDRAKLKIGNGKRDKEFCDILDLQNNSAIRIINCKPYKDATSINYLFSQAKFYCDAFLSDQTFLTEVRAHISKSTSSKKKEYLALIPPKIEDHGSENFRLCLWLLYDAKDKEPSKNSIPLIAQYELKLMHDHLRRVWKFREIVLRFVPVTTTNFKTSRKPNKSAV